MVRVSIPISCLNWGLLLRWEYNRKFGTKKLPPSFHDKQCRWELLAARDELQQCLGVDVRSRQMQPPTTPRAKRDPVMFPSRWHTCSCILVAVSANDSCQDSQQPKCAKRTYQQNKIINWVCAGWGQEVHVTHSLRVFRIAARKMSNPLAEQQSKKETTIKSVKSVQ